MLPRSLLLLASTITSSAALGQPIPPPPPPPFAGDQVVRITVTTGQELHIVEQMAENIWSCSYGIGPIDVQLTSERAAALRGWAAENNLDYRVLVPDVQAWVDAEQAAIELAHRQRSVDWYAVYRNPTEISAKLDEWGANFPTMAQLFTAGTSLENRPIRGISISSPDRPGNPRSGRVQIVFNGAQHAREWLSPMVNMYIAEQLLSLAATDARVQRVMDRVEFFIVPVVNVDGYAFTWASTNNRFWRKNRRVNAGSAAIGVDTNRNWGFQWGSDNGSSGDPANDTYRGAAAFSEPEPAAMRDLMNALPRLVAYIDIHSYGYLFMYPWGYTNQLCSDNSFYAAITQAMVEGQQFATGDVYTAGPVYGTLYSVSGGALDWGYGGRGVASWTIELPTNVFDPSPSVILPTVISNFEAILRLGEWMSSPSMRYLDVQPMSRWLAPGVSAQAGVTPRTTFGAVTSAPTMYSRPVGGGGAFAAAVMTPGAGGRYTGQAYSGECGGGIEYYFEAIRADGTTVRSPDDAPVALYTTVVAASTITYSDDMETNRGWTVGAPTDTATSGIWALGTPASRAGEPTADTTPGAGTKCWITGPAAGSDVSGGETTLTSPRFAATLPVSNIADATVSFYLWYSNDSGPTRFTDSLRVLISSDDGATWAQLDQVSNDAHQWVRKTYSLGAAALLTNTMRLRLVASDLGENDRVEAALDDVVVTVFGCRRDADVNHDGGVDGQDVETFFRAWEAGQMIGDFNADGGIDGLDIGAFFEAWELG